MTGIDAMIVDGQTYILEMNNRFQGSTMLLNLALKDAGLPSMQEFNYEAFCEDVPKRSFNSLEVPYSMFIYMANEKGEVSETHKRNFALESTLIGCYDDGLNVEWKIAPHATLERMVFRTNIVSITPEAKVALHPNINDMNTEWYDEIVQKRNKLYLKIALINHGVVISEEAKEYLMKDGGIREAVYNAVDIYLDDIVVNSAVSVKFTALSPFNIQLENDKLSLYCCNARLQTIEIQRADYIREKRHLVVQPLKIFACWQQIGSEYSILETAVLRGVRRGVIFARLKIMKSHLKWRIFLNPLITILILNIISDIF